ncbi:MAG: hypothetical protein ABIR62_10840 [Dokdonella sp.]|uniref:hypothetical protein n=1 Tax=Dokdonella sp. TaxID=2291710 RepID=UPI003262E461
MERCSPQGRGANVKSAHHVQRAWRADARYDVRRQRRTQGNPAHVPGRDCSYSDREAFVFMGTEGYTQYTLNASVVGDSAGCIADGIEGCQMQLIDGMPEPASQSLRAQVPYPSRLGKPEEYADTVAFILQNR